MRFLLLLTLCITTTLFAHKLNLFLYDEAGKLYVQSYFTQSSPCKTCEVVLFDKEHKELAKAVTNEQGKAVLPLPSSSFTVVVKATMGHQQQAFYEVQSQIEEKAKDLPTQPPADKAWQKMLLGLLIIAGIFSLLRLVKRT